MKTLRNTLFVLLVTLMVIAIPVAVFAQDGGNFSGDDAYDPAASASVAPTSPSVVNFSGDDAYDVAAEGLYYEPTIRYVSNFSGDDAYDLVAGSLLYPETACKIVGNYSGDDDYDQGFGWPTIGVATARAQVC